MIGHNTQPVPPQLANYSHGNVMNDIDDIQLHHHTELLPGQLTTVVVMS